MSPARFNTPASDAVATAVRRFWIEAGLQIRDARLAKRWTVEALAYKAGVSSAVVYLAERGEPTSPEAVIRIAGALGLRVELELSDPRRRNKPQRLADPVHSAMGEVESQRLRLVGVGGMGIDEPYQHFQYAGRADLVAWDLDIPALLHIENRTRFPDLQEMAGSYNAKRAYLGASLAERLGIRGWRSQTHVIAALWSSEVLHMLRLRRASFRTLCPDPMDAFLSWWNGEPPLSGVPSALIVLDPLASGRQRMFIGLDDALDARPRHAGYAQVAARLETAALENAARLASAA
jgi:transcriptional regulator with XRE-family HTH domain